MRLISALTAMFIVFAACEKEIDVNTNKDTYSDDISDITYLNGGFYTTNYDLSGHSGSQIDLFKFTADGKNVDDAFDLGMNGQSYLAITNDGRNIYMQSNWFYWIIKCSPVGELVFVKSDSLPGKWHAAGICYRDDLDSLALFYNNSDAPLEYRVRIVSKADPEVASHDTTVEFNFLDQTCGIYAADYYNPNYYLLGVNSNGEDVLIETDVRLNVLSTDTIGDSTVVGLCHKDGNLYLSFRDRRIELWAN